MANKKVRTRATASGVTDGMRPRIANGENDIVDNDDNENDFVTASGAADDHLSDLTTLQSEKTSFILTPKTYLSLGTLNVRTLAKPGKRELVLNEMNRYRWDIVGLSETHLPSTGIERINDITLITSGRSDGVHRQGVGFLLSKRAKQSLLAVHPVSERIITIRLKGSIANMTIIQVYAPDSSRSDQEAEEFYSQLQHTVDTAPKKDVLFVIGDFNAIVGHSNDGLEDVMGKFGHGRQNHRGEMLIEFCRDNEPFNSRRN